MEGISGINASGGAMPLQFQVQYQAKVASLQKSAVEMQGDMVMQLLQSVADTQVGGQLDISV